MTPVIAALDGTTTPAGALLVVALVLPVIATTEVKAILPDAQPSHHGDDDHV